MKKYPNIRNAEKIWREEISYRLANYPFPEKEEYIFHSRGVGRCCRIIAEHTQDLNPEKAYVLGLLHDCGKRVNEKLSGRFHVREGYDLMEAMDYTDVARVCLTHSFYSPNFDEKFYPSYRPEWLTWAKDKMRGITFNDYDRLVQLCDLFFEGLEKVCLKKRFEGLIRRYNLQWPLLQSLYQHALDNKKFFDEKCGCCIYDLLEIKNED